MSGVLTRGRKGKEPAPCGRKRWKERDVQYVALDCFTWPSINQTVRLFEDRNSLLSPPSSGSFFSINGPPNLLLPVTVVGVIVRQHARHGGTSCSLSTLSFCQKTRDIPDAHAHSPHLFGPLMYRSEPVPHIPLLVLSSRPFSWPKFPPARSLISWCKSAFPRDGGRLKKAHYRTHQYGGINHPVVCVIHCSVRVCSKQAHKYDSSSFMIICFLQHSPLSSTQHKYGDSENPSFSTCWIHPSSILIPGLWGLEGHIYRVTTHNRVHLMLFDCGRNHIFMKVITWFFCCCWFNFMVCGAVKMYCVIGYWQVFIMCFLPYRVVCMIHCALNKPPSWTTYALHWLIFYLLSLLIYALFTERGAIPNLWVGMPQGDPKIHLRGHRMINRIKKERKFCSTMLIILSCEIRHIFISAGL